MSVSRRALALLALAAACLAVCEKETHRAARREFQELMGRGLAAEAQAAALEAFVERFPEPKTNPYLARACNLLAEHHARAGRPDIAASWYERALRAAPDDPDLLNALGYHYARHALNLDRAVTVLETAARLAEERHYPDRRQGFIKDSLGWAYRVRGDLPQAIPVLEEAARLAPGVPIIREHLADAYRAIGERERAVAIYLDLYLGTRGTDARLRQVLADLGREGGPPAVNDVARRLEAGLRSLANQERRETEAAGGSLVQLRVADGYRLSGSLFLPPGPPRRGRGAAAPRTAAVLLLHALGSSRRAASPEALALAGRGLVALAIDLRGHGASVSEALPDARTFTEHLAANLEAAVQDTRAGLDYLARHPRVASDRIGVIGAGLGGLLAARSVDLPGARPPAALVILSPWGRAEAYQPLLRALDPRSFLLLSGAEEASSVVLRSLEDSLRGASGRALLVPGPGGGYDLAARDPGVAERIATFLEDRLIGGPGGSAP